jgi:hypothetical protein
MHAHEASWLPQNGQRSFVQPVACGGKFIVVIETDQCDLAS